jgi:epoxyqueuosine reductase
MQAETAALKEKALARGAALFGIADLDRIRKETDLLDARYNIHKRGISIGVVLNPVSLTGLKHGPTQEYCREYLRVNRLLDFIAEETASNIAAKGYRAERIPASQVVDWERLRGHLPHKLIGRYAGLGWIGKSILLVNDRYGARVRYVTVLTDMPLEPQAPAEQDCGACDRCTRVCPAGAIGIRFAHLF